MAYQVNYIPDDDIVKVTVDGEFSFEGILNLSSQLVSELTKHKSNRVLNDQRNATLNLSTLEIYKLPRVAKAFGVANNTKVAIVHNENKKDYRFIESAAINSGLIVKIFAEFEDAKRWLIETPTQPIKLDI